MNIVLFWLIPIHVCNWLIDYCRWNKHFFPVFFSAILLFLWSDLIALFIIVTSIPAAECVSDKSLSLEKYTNSGSNNKPWNMVIRITWWSQWIIPSSTLASWVGLVWPIAFNLSITVSAWYDSGKSHFPNKSSPESH